MNVFENSKWIWCSENAGADEYAEFFTEFDIEKNDSVILRLSCDSDYTLFINGKFVASNQYADFEYYKIYDELDLTGFTKKGRNTLSAIVWHFGIETSRYKKYAAGLIFEILEKDRLALASSENTLARKSPCYESGRCELITGQLGYGFHYDASREDGTLFTGVGFDKATVIEKDCEFYKRIGEKLRLANEAKKTKTTVGNDGKYYLIDLSEETVGLLTLKFKSPSVQKLRIDWGEHLDSGHVRRIIGKRTFSVEYTAKPGENDYTNYMLRFGCRYIEVYSEEPIILEYAGIISQYYPTTAKSATLENSLDQRIYDLCLNTLKLSMMEHYVDCPWREQALYAFDSRNQMLSGYYAFENGNAEYAYSNLKLISQDRRFNGLLSICYPTGKKLAIPSFSLHYLTAVSEYYEHTDDKAFLEYVYPKLVSIIETFHSNSDGRLIYTFEGKEHWNFYDWSMHLDGELNRGGPRGLDSVINLLYIISLDRLEKISDILGKPFTYAREADRLRRAVTEAFFNSEDGLFSFRPGEKDYTELANSLAIIAGVADKKLAENICESILSGRVTESSLSLKCFMYDALLMTDKKYKDFVLDEIRKNYGYMLDAGATSAWETLKGADDFGGAGSLCHGWSAIPVYYYHKFGMVRQE